MIPSIPSGEEVGESSRSPRSPRSPIPLPKSASSSSLPPSTPPQPPPDFNPPADTSPGAVEAALHAISPPFEGSNPPTTVSPRSTSDSPGSLGLVAPGFLSRPALQTLLTNSSDVSSGTNSQSSGIFSVGSSEGGEHLVEARHDLISQSGHASREESEDEEEGGEVAMDTEAETADIPTALPRSIFDVHVIAATPPLQAASLQGGERRRRRSSGEAPRMESQASWDSVWPTPEVLARANSSSHEIPTSSSSRYPAMAPVSPFITPSFSPAIFPVGSSRPNHPIAPLVPIRRSSSPNRRASSPRRPSPFTTHSETFESPMDFPSGRRGSITASDLPPLYAPSSSSSSTPVTISKHQRSFSSSSDISPTSRSAMSGKRPTSPRSPPQSPRRSLPGDRPGSPARRHRKQTAPIPATSRLADLGSSPDQSEGLLRPRGQSMSSRSSPYMPPDESEPGPSRRYRSSPLSPPSQALPRAAPDDDIPPLDTRSDGLPPPIASPPVFGGSGGFATDDGMVRLPPAVVNAAVSPPPLSSPLYAPLARPAALRRALSDYETRSARSTPPGMSRSSSLSSDLDKSPTRVVSPLSPVQEGRIKRSPRRTIESLPPAEIPEPGLPPESTEEPPDDPSSNDQISDVQLVDEGDMLPQESDMYMDITFEDEGLNTLERIFLLSKSEFAFHRAYIARVLGDLLYDVDPCESVEYVLPLISSFTLDEDEGVREAFAQDLHRIIWYFFSVCRIAQAGTDAQAPVVPGQDWAGAEEGQGEEWAGQYGEGQEGNEEVGVDDIDAEGDTGDYFSPSLAEHEPPPLPHRDSSNQTVTISSAGLEVVDKPPEAEEPERQVVAAALDSLSSGPTSDGSTLSQVALTAFDSEGGDTPASSIRRDSADQNIPQEGYNDPIGTASSAAPVEGPLLDRPNLPVDFFTPLLGSLLLNVNAVISESVRGGLILLLARLKGKGEVDPERWGIVKRDLSSGRRTFPNQNGPHSHDFLPIPEDERDMIEKELLEGLVIGMGRLSVEMPEHLFDEVVSLEDGQAVLENYAESSGQSQSGRSSIGGNSQSSELSREREAFQMQLIAEATAGRATSMNLIGALCDHYTGPEVVAWGFIEEVLRCNDGDVPVRAEGAVALSMLAKIAPVEYIYSFIPLFEVLASDELGQVRQSACLSLPSICRRIESPDYRRSFAIKAMHSLTTFNADVRCAALEVLGELIYVFADDPRGPPMELMQVYLDEEDVRRGFGEDWDTVASFNFPGVALTLGPDRWSDIRPLYHRMNERAGEKPRRALAASLHELAKILTPDQCAEDLMPVFRTCLTGVDEIRELVFEHIDVFLDNLPLPLAWDTYLELAQAWKDNDLGGWRAREQLALHIPAFFKTFHELMGDEVLGMLKDALLDPFAAVRDAATKGIPEAYEILGDDSDIANRFRENLLELGRSSKFKQRQTFVRCLREFVKPPPNRQAFEDFFLPFLSSLSRDVVDVRLGLAQTVADLFVVGAFYADKVHAPKAILDLARQLADDEAVDVRDTVRNVDLEHLESNDTVPYEIKKPQVEKRAVTPGDLVPDHAPVQPKSTHHDQDDAEDEEDDRESKTSPRSESPTIEDGNIDVSDSNDPTPTATESKSPSSSSSRPDQTLFNHRSNSFHHRIRIDRRSSPDPSGEDDASRANTRMQFDTGLLTPTTPGTGGRRSGSWGSGHYHSSPSPNEPRGGMDPFSVSFARATPEGSPAIEARVLESPGLSRSGELPPR